MNREGTLIVTHFCRHDCGNQRITETKANGARRVYYLRGDFFGDR